MAGTHSWPRARWFQLLGEVQGKCREAFKRKRRSSQVGTTGACNKNITNEIYMYLHNCY